MAEPIAETFYRRPTMIVDEAALTEADKEALCKIVPGNVVKVPADAVQFMRGEPEHLVELRRAFPGVWVRDDGSFRAEDFGIRWVRKRIVGPLGSKHGDVAADELYSSKVQFRSLDYGDKSSSLTLEQLEVLAKYVRIESQNAGEESANRA